jgi:hypothetical protein
MGCGSSKEQQGHGHARGSGANKYQPGTNFGHGASDGMQVRWFRLRALCVVSAALRVRAIRPLLQEGWWLRGQEREATRGGLRHGGTEALQAWCVLC